MLNLGRRLAELAADAVRREDRATRSGHDPPPWRRDRPDPLTTLRWRPPVASVRGASRPLEDRHLDELISVIRVAVVGGPDPLGEALTEDARGWSPALAFATRAEAEAAVRDQASPLTVLSFDVEDLYWAEPVVFAEWRLDAVVTEPLLVADDVLVEARGRPVTLAGATVAELRGGRVVVVHTYYDDAALIEQVILDG